jgi:hypothetical protein
MWGGLSLVLMYVLDVINIQVLGMIPVEIGLPALGLLILATLFSVTLTLLAYRRTHEKNTYLIAKRDGADAVLPTSGWRRLVDRLVPDVVLVNTFPRMSLITEYQELSGHHRKLIVWLPTIGKPSAITAAAGERARNQEAARLIAAGDVTS